MPKWLTILALSFVFSSATIGQTYSDVKLNGFWGIDWTKTQAEAKKKLLSKNAEITSERKGIIEAVGKFAEKDAVILLLFTDEGVFFSGIVCYKIDAISQMRLDLANVVYEVANKYGRPAIESGNLYEIITPYRKLKDHENDAVGKTSLKVPAIWFFPEGKSIATGILNDIDGYYVAIIYYSQDIFKTLEKKLMQQGNGDY